MANNISKQPKIKVLIVADYFIDKNNKTKKGLSNKKLQKLLYYAQAWSLVINKNKLFDSKIEAWVHGPAIPAVYSKFKRFGFNDIEVDVDEKEFAKLSGKEKTILDEVWRVYGKFDAPYLEMLTHNEIPWQEARRGLLSHEASGKEISLDSMKEYYGKKIQKKS